MTVAFIYKFCLDSNVSLINALNKKNNVYFFTEALYEIYNFIDREKLDKTISQGKYVEELERFSELIPLQKTYVVKGTRNSNILKKLYTSYKINRYIKKINPDVIVIDNYMLTYLFSVLLYRKKMLLIVHDPFLHSGENFRIDRLLRKIFFFLIDHKMLLNENQKKDFIKHYQQKDKYIHSSFLSIYDYLTYYKKDYSYPSSEFNILFFGRISPYKGIKYLLMAFVEIIESQNYPDITLTIAGSGSFDFDIEVFKKYPQIKIINEYIHPQKLADLISQSVAVVCPYTDATQSGVIMSAFAFKKPVIATNVGGLPEMVEDGKTGLIIEPKNSKEILDSILKLYKDKKLIEQMSKNISEKYFTGDKSWDSSADIFMNVFEKIKNEI